MSAASPGIRDPILTTETGQAVGLGGPIVKDHLFFYGSARYSRQSKWDRLNKVGTPLPDELEAGPEFYTKLTAAPTTDHQVTGSYRHRPSHVDNAGLGSDFAPSVATRTQNGSGIGTAEWAHFITARHSLNVRHCT